MNLHDLKQAIIRDISLHAGRAIDEMLAHKLITECGRFPSREECARNGFRVKFVGAPCGNCDTADWTWFAWKNHYLFRVRYFPFEIIEMQPGDEGPVDLSNRV